MKPAVLPLLLLLTVISPCTADTPPRYKMTVKPEDWVLNKAIGINDNGWIIGEGSIHKTPKGTQAVKSFTFLLTPR